MCRYFVNFLLAIIVLASPVIVSASRCLSPVDATDPNDSGTVWQAQEDQGNGQISCSVFYGKGGQMYQIPVSQDKTFGTLADPIHVYIPDPDPNINFDVVIIETSDGKRCNYFTQGNTRSVYVAAESSSNKDQTVVACADGFVEPEPPSAPVPPITTADDCGTNDYTKAFQQALDNNPVYDWVILGGRNLESGGEGNTAICVDQQNGDGQLSRCVNRCITPSSDSSIPWYELDSAERTANCEGDGPFFPIECRGCALAAEVGSDIFDPETQFCWEQLQKATLGPSHGYPNGSFRLPPPAEGKQGWGVETFKGSTCYLISGQTKSGWPYSYWTPSGCPD